MFGNLYSKLVIANQYGKIENLLSVPVTLFDPTNKITDYVKIEKNNCELLDPKW